MPETSLWCPGYPLPASGRLHANTLYAVPLPGDGFGTFIIYDERAYLRVIRGEYADQEVTRGAAQELLESFGYTPISFTIGGRFV